MIRYVVFSKVGLYHLSDRWDGLKKLKLKNILCFGKPATTFKTIKSAERALERTKKYADVYHTNWRGWLDESYVVRIEIDASV